MKCIITLVLFMGGTLFATSLQAQFWKKVEKIFSDIDKEIGKQERPSQRRTIVQKSVTFEDYSLGFQSESPNNFLRDISLPSFRELPRVGEQDRSGRDAASWSRLRQSISKNHQQFRYLLAFNYLEDILVHLDTVELISSRTPGARSLQREALIAQELILQMAIHCCDSKSAKKYFCSPGENCQISRKRYLGWGGTAGLKNEFDRTLSYQAFIKDNYQGLLRWSRELENEAYLVMPSKLETYDFQKGAFPIHISPGRSPENGGYYLPKNDFEKQLMGEMETSGSFATLIKYLQMDLEEGKALRERVNLLYFVYRIKYYDVFKKDKLVRGGHSPKNFLLSYCLESPIVEIYEDNSLTKKLAEFSIE